LLAALAALAVIVVPRASGSVAGQSPPTRPKPGAPAREAKQQRKQVEVPAVFSSTAEHVRSLARIERRRDATWRWQRLTGRPISPYDGSATESRSLRYHRWVLRLWQRRAAHAWRRALSPPHEREWLCIHRYEGRWDDPGAPYYGGLQMDLEFQRTYGPELLRRKGTADNWTPLEQMWVAERAFRSGRGFYPWPNTARACGLL
jgi:hypothetical protein